MAPTHRITALLALAVSVAPAPAQGLVQSNETFHYGILGADLGGGCGGGVRPQLASAGGASRFGNAAFALELSRAVGGALGVFAVAGRPAPGVPGFGGTVWVDSGALLVSSTITTSGVAGVAGAGTGSLALPLTGSSSLIGADLYAQVFVLDMGATAGVSMTRGLAVDVCQ